MIPTIRQAIDRVIEGSSPSRVLNDLIYEKKKPNSEADKETELIKQNKQKPEAKKRHKFKPAKWTHPNGHPRCIICGDEERIGGYCNGRG